MKLEIKNLRVHYGKVEALKTISLDIGEGETVALMGANGAGKSTTLKAVSGLKKVTSGEITFDGKRLDKMSPQEIVKLGVIQIPEGRRLFYGMTVLDNLLLGAYLRKDRKYIKKDLEDIYRHFPVLGQRRGQRAGTLSGGEQQMLAISRALMAKPRLLLLDEPSIGLSPVVVSEIGRVIADIGLGGMAVFLVEQNARLAFKLSQRGYVLETGKVVLSGSTIELSNNEYVKKAYLG